MCAHVLFTITRMSFLCQSFVIVCHLYVTGITCMSSACQSYVLVCYPYVTRMNSYVIRMSLVCTQYVIHMPLVYTRMPFVYHSYVLVCYPYVTRMWFYHEPNAARMLKLTDFQINTPYLDKILTVNGIL